jgi:hypothetical protein
MPASTTATSKAGVFAPVSGDGPVKIASSASKRDRSSIATSVGKDPDAKPPQLPGDDAAALAGKQISPASESGHMARTAASTADAPADHGDRGESVSAALHTSSQTACVSTLAPATPSPLTPAVGRVQSSAPIPPAGQVPGGHQILSSGPAQLDVGVLDSTHGWLQIRAELGATGAVSASVTGSASAHASLSEVLPEMASYLQSEALGIGSIAVHRSTEAAHAPAGTAAQTDADAQGQAPRGGQAQDDAGGSRKNPTPADAFNDGAATEPMGVSAATAPETNAAAANGVPEEATAQWGNTAAAPIHRGLAAALPGFTSAGFLPGSSGGWLNVSA